MFHSDILQAIDSGGHNKIFLIYHKFYLTLSNIFDIMVMGDHPRKGGCLKWLNSLLRDRFI